MALAITTATALFVRWRSRSIFIPLFLLTYYVVGVCLLRNAGPPTIDVYEVCRDSCDALAEGHNPYAIDFPDVYANRPDWEKAFYPPGLVVNGRVQFGYPYMPLDLILEFPGQRLTGDYRIANLLAITAAAGFMAYMGASTLSVAAAALFLFGAKDQYVVQTGWVDPMIVLALSAVVFIARYRPAWTPGMLGLLLVAKQDMFLAAPAALLLLDRPLRWRPVLRFALIAVAAGSIVTSPLMLWDFHAFWHSAAQVQMLCPFRYDSLSFSAAWARSGHAPPPDILAFLIALAAAAVAIAAIGRRRSPAGFALVTAITYLCFFSTAKQAFCNYYFMTIGILCCAVAASDGKD
ncbi:MAG TPA: hypothetical protein VL992_04700 [Tepidisphaeraceae bacterium]|nr:hypothetical protein [Tepidisphaeraceae bacterium]